MHICTKAVQANQSVAIMTSGDGKSLANEKVINKQINPFQSIYSNKTPNRETRAIVQAKTKEINQQTTSKHL